LQDCKPGQKRRSFINYNPINQRKKKVHKTSEKNEVFSSLKRIMRIIILIILVKVAERVQYLTESPHELSKKAMII
jgi:hypothetical protein